MDDVAAATGYDEALTVVVDEALRHQHLPVLRQFYCPRCERLVGRVVKVGSALLFTALRYDPASTSARLDLARYAAVTGQSAAGWRRPQADRRYALLTHPGRPESLRAWCLKDGDVPLS